ncbi:hypothetical protein EJB05_37906, partial [Eragrostis curvula]
MEESIAYAYLFEALLLSPFKLAQSMTKDDYMVQSMHGGIHTKHCKSSQLTLAEKLFTDT